MVVGLGAGTTAAYVLEPLAMRVRTGAVRDVVCVPCSSEAGARARSFGLSVATLADRPCVDLTIDGSDEVDGALDSIKGRGGALSHEKMVAQASRREVSERTLELGACSRRAAVEASRSARSSM